MSYVSISLAPQWDKRLAAVGLKIPTLRQGSRLGPRTTFEPPCFMGAEIANPTTIEIAAFSNFNAGQIGEAKVGRYTAIARDVTIGAHEHPTDWLTCSRVGHYPEVFEWDRFVAPDKLDFIRSHRKPFPGSIRTTTIGNDVWIGQGVFIRNGITIGDGAIIGARSVVTKDVPPYAVVAGIPAQVRKLRFPEKTVERLLAVRWWRFSLYDCYDAPFKDVERSLDIIEERAAAGTLTEYAPRRFDPNDLNAVVAASEAA